MLKAGEGPRVLRDGVLVRPLITGAESGGARADAAHEGHAALYVLDGRVRVAGLDAGPGDCVSLPAGDHVVEVTGAQARWLATVAPAGGEPRPHVVFAS